MEEDVETLNARESEEYVYVRERAAMGKLIERIGAAERVALDTEADSLHNYFEKVCLIQLSLGGEHYLVDPLCDLDLSGFSEALAEKPLILHGGDYDLRMMRASMGFRPRREVFDTMIAAQLLGIRTDRAGRAHRAILWCHHRKSRAEIRLVAPAAERQATALRGQRHAFSRTARRPFARRARANGGGSIGTGKVAGRWWSRPAAIIHAIPTTPGASREPGG